MNMSSRSRFLLALSSGMLLLALSLRMPAAAWERHVIDDTSRGADGVKTADVNSDGLLDLVTAWEEGNSVRVYLNPGPAKAKQPWPFVEVGKVKAGEDAVFVDLDKDGAMDIVSCAEGNTRTMFVHWAPSAPAHYRDAARWKTEVIPASVDKMRWMFCEPMDVDGENGIDLIAGGKEDNAAVGWWESPKNPRDLAAWNFHKISDAGWIMSIIVEDMDGDGFADILLTDRKGKAMRGARWLKNPGKGTPAQKQPWANSFLHPGGKPFSEELMFAVVADLDQDGRRDVLAAAKGKGILYLRRLDANGLQWAESWIGSAGNVVSGTGRGIKAVAVADLDQDGQLDIVCDVEYYDKPKVPGVFLLRHKNSPHDTVWNHEALDQEGGKFDIIQFMDLDGDGDLDIVTSEEIRRRGVIWFENPHKQPEQ